MDDSTQFMLGCLGIALVLAFGPSILFWCIDTLFAFHIPLTPKTWLAGNLLIGMVSAR